MNLSIWRQKQELFEKKHQKYAWLYAIFCGVVAGLWLAVSI